MNNYSVIDLDDIEPTPDKPSNQLIKTIRDNNNQLDTEAMLERIKGSDYKYRVVYGRRRVNALRKLGVKEYQFAIVRDLSDKDYHTLALRENLSGRDNTGNEAIHIGKLIDSGLNRYDIIGLTGATYWTVKNRHDIYKKLIPEFLDMLCNWQINPAAANELIKLKPEEQKELLLLHGTKLKAKNVKAYSDNQRLDRVSTELTQLEPPTLSVDAGHFISGTKMKKLLETGQVQINFQQESYILSIEKL